MIFLRYETRGLKGTGTALFGIAHVYVVCEPLPPKKEKFDGMSTQVMDDARWQGPSKLRGFGLA